MSSHAGKRQFVRTKFSIGAIEVDPVLCLVKNQQGEVTELSRRQILAIIELAQNYGSVVSRAKMHNILCLTDEGMRDKGALSHHISIIRKAFGDNPKSPTYIRTVRSQGYFLLIEPIQTDEETAHSSMLSSPAIKPTIVNGTNNGARPAFRPKSIGLVTVILCLSLISIVGLYYFKPLNSNSLEPQAAQGVLSQQTAEVKPLQRRTGSSRSNPAPRPNKFSHISHNGESPDEANLVADLKRRYFDLLEDQSIPEELKASLLLDVGRNLMYLRSWNAATLALEDSLSLQRSKTEQTDPVLLAVTLTSLAQLQSSLDQNIDRSRDLLVEATNLMRNTQVNNDVFIKMLNVHAGLMMFDNNGLAAESLLMEALNLVDRQSQVEHSLVVALNVSLAKALTMQSKFDQALRLTEELLRSNDQQPLRDLRQLVPIINQHGFLLSSMGRYEDSVDAYQRVFDIDSAYYPDDHRRILHAKFSLADSLLDAGRAERAIEIYTQLLAHYTQQETNDPVRLSSLKLRLSTALLESKQAAKAYQEIEQVTGILQNETEIPGWLGYSLSSLQGAALIELGNCEKGLQLINQAVEQAFLDSVSDPRITSKIHQRKTHYESSGQCA